MRVAHPTLLDRLKTDGTSTFNYDADGNRSSLSVGATNYAYTYAANSNKLTTIAGPTAATYSLDASGNVTATGGKTFGYDARGRLTNVSVGTTTSYGINGLGQRTTKAGTGYTGTIRLVYAEDGKLLGEYDNAGAIIAEHVYLNDTPIAVIKGTGAYLVQADHLNTPRAILGASNALVWKWDSDAFGTTAANENPSALGTFNYNLRFPGQYYDKETANHYNTFRDNYNPKIGRYMQSDPIGLRGGINTYAYVDENPINFVDPYGLFELPGWARGALWISRGVEAAKAIDKAVNYGNTPRPDYGGGGGGASGNWPNGDPSNTIPFPGPAIDRRKVIDEIIKEAIHNEMEKNRSKRPNACYAQ